MKKKPPLPARKPANCPVPAGKRLVSLTKTRAPTAASTIRRLRAELALAQSKIAELRASAETDFLLDILNRRGFERELTRALSYIARYQATGALVVLDVDRLKPINDAYGHAAGDEVLKAVVSVLRRHVRASDVIGRLGGDEFVLLLWNLNEEEARSKALQLEAAIDALSFSFSNTNVSAGASAGISVLATDMSGGTALEQADRAMYARKKQRRTATASNEEQAASEG